MASNAARLVLDGFYDTIVIRFVGEIGIKSEKVRRRLIDRLAACIENQLERKRVRGLSLSMTHARLFLVIKDRGDVEAVHELLQRIPGIHSFSYCTVLPIDLAKVHSRAVALARLLLRDGTSFAVRVTREGKHEFTSQTLARDVGSSIYETLKGIHPRVDLTAPDVTVYLEVRDDTVVLYHEKYDGFGGMPRDVSSPVLGCVGLASASWDACHRVIKRGSNLHPVLLHRTGQEGTAAPGDPSAGEISGVLNADPDLVDNVFRLLDLQEDNTVRLTFVPVDGELAEWLDSEPASSDPRATATFLAIAVPALLNARVRSESAGAPRKSSDYKAIVSDYQGGADGSGSAGTLRWIQAASAAVDAMMPAGVPALPLLFPLMPGEAGEAGRAAATGHGQVPPRSDGALLGALGQPATREELRALLQTAVDQARVLKFDMVERRFLSRG